MSENKLLRHLFEGRHTESTINLTIGAPGPSTLARITEIFQKSTEALASLSGSKTNSAQGGGVVFQYGPSCGYGPYIETLAQFLNNEYQDAEKPVAEENLLCTSGATIGLWLATTVFLPPGQGVIFIECPSYFIALDVLSSGLGHRSVPIPMDHNGSGINIDILEEAMRLEFEKRTIGPQKDKFWAMLYTIPTFHNPTGSVLSAAKSKRIIDLARKFDILVFCDDVYNLLCYDNLKPPKRLFAYDNPNDADYKGNVISNGSFSKILGPGYRVGWMEVAPRMMMPLVNSGIIQSGGSMNNVMSGVIACALQQGFQKKHLQYLRNEYKERLDKMFEVLDKNLPLGFQTHKPKGGYFVWVSGPDDFDADSFATFFLNEHKVNVLPSSKCGKIESRPWKNSFRMSIAFYDSPAITDGMKSLCTALSQFYKL